MDSDKEKLLARMRAIVEKHLDGVVTFEQGHALIDDLTALFAAPSPAQLDKTHYQCERCGGMGQQPAGVYRMGTKKYDAPAGTCELCGGTGYLGPYAPSPAQAAGGEYEWPDASLEEVVWLRGCNLYSMKLTDAGVMVRELSGSIWWDKDEVGMNGGWIPCRVARSAPEAGEGERPERPPMLLAATVRPFARITDWAWYVRSGDDWMMVLSDVYTCDSEHFIGVDRERSDPAALALYDAETAPAPKTE
jgi:hypothetical protein